MPRKQTPAARNADIKAKFLERAEELWEEHESQFFQVLEEAESKKVNLTFKAHLDFSESAAKLKTDITFSQVMKDGREDTFDDPNQRALPGIAGGENEGEPADEPKGKAAGKKGTKGKKGGDFVPPEPESE